MLLRVFVTVRLPKPYVSSNCQLGHRQTANSKQRYFTTFRYLPVTTKERVVNAIITSRLDYCNSLLYGTCVNNIARLQRMHKSAARLILRRPRSDSATPLLCILHWLRVARRIEFKLLVFTYRAVHGEAPKYLCNLVCPYTPRRVLRSANNNMLTVQWTHVKAGFCSFTVAAATLWNTLPIDIKMSDTLHFQGTPKDSLL